jgi:hypothetical protein
MVNFLPARLAGGVSASVKKNPTSSFNSDMKRMTTNDLLKNEVKQ